MIRRKIRTLHFSLLPNGAQDTCLRHIAPTAEKRAKCMQIVKSNFTFARKYAKYLHM